MKPLRLGLFSALILFAGAAVAMAQQNVVITADINAYKGPSLDSEFAGTVRANTPVVLDHCESNFCMVYYGRATIWVQQQYVAQTPKPHSEPMPLPQPQPQPQPQPWPQPQPQPQPQPWPWPQPLPRPLPPPPIFDDSAGACFYSERNFGGSSFCVDEGDGYSRLRNWDNRIRSVEVFGGANVDLCTDSNYRGNCITLRRDASRLPSQIDRKTSSIDVY